VNLSGSGHTLVVEGNMAVMNFEKLYELYRLVGFVLVDEAIVQLKEYFGKAFPNELPRFEAELKNHQEKYGSCRSGKNLREIL
jgi:hypothetical protein